MIIDIWNIYGDELNKYYNIYEHDEKYKDILIDDLRKYHIKTGTNKIVYRYNNDKFIQCQNQNQTQSLETDVLNHILILIEYYKYDYNSFYIPKIYFNETYYVIDFIDIDYLNEKNKNIFYIKNFRIDENYCNSYGEFINFMFNKVNMDIVDIESYIDKNHKLVFLDFGECKKIDLENLGFFIKIFIYNLYSYCITNSGKIYDYSKMNHIEYFKKEECKRGIKCIIDNIENSEIYVDEIEVKDDTDDNDWI
jgi:hypothetical protein